MRSLLLAAAVLLGACTSPYAADCAKAKECGELGDQTEKQCSAKDETCSDKQHSSGIDACVKLADALDDLTRCTAGLECNERSSSALFKKCKDQLDAVASASQAAAHADCPDCE